MQVIIIQATVSTKVTPPYIGVTPRIWGCSPTVEKHDEHVKCEHRFFLNTLYIGQATLNNSLDFIRMILLYL